jgi:TetR/AcrR family transcriptional regulator, mexJK operon transcriptional repressor
MGDPHSARVSTPGTAPPRRSRRGRPTAERAAAIDATIVAAALELFLECGYEAATMEAIAERAGVSKGTLYARYPSKEPLFRAVLQERRNRWSDLNSAITDPAPTEFTARLWSRARTLQRMFEWPEFVQISRLIQSSTATFPDVAGYWREIGTQHFLELLADDMKYACEESSAVDLDWNFLANMFLHTFSGWYRQESAARRLDEAEISAFVDQLIQTILTTIASATQRDGNEDNSGD